ncbi:MAG: fibronectin type III domain-containing protein [Deltaproteobacteria bacterium]|nr:fibronectin type III domain-containing protein [Deltaproteobacteria bacterium]
MLASGLASGASGGPDNYGYVWSDALPFAWVDTAGGFPISLGDDSAVSVALGFDFDFYGQPYDAAWVVSNGYLAFTEISTTYVNQCALPDPLSPNGALYFYWDDLIPPGGGTARYQYAGAEPYRHFILTFENVQFFGSLDVLTAQIILTESVGWMQIAYEESGEGGLDAVIGLENSTGTDGLTAFCDEAAVEDETGLFFGLPGVSDLRAETDEAGLAVVWDDLAGAEEFSVELRPMEASDWTLLGVTNEPRLPDPAAQECAARRYRVSAFAGEFGRAAPVEKSLTFFPLAPGGLTAVGIGDARVELFWRDRSGCEDGYVVERRDGDGPFARIATLSEGTETFADDDPSGDATYRVKATSGVLAGAYSNEAAIGARLFAPDHLAAEGYSDTKISLTWEDTSDGEDGFAVERRAADGGADFETAATVGPDSETHLDFDLDPNTSYEYRVRAFTLETSGPFSETVSAQTLEEGTGPGDTGDDNGDRADDDDDDDGGCCGC